MDHALLCPACTRALASERKAARERSRQTRIAELQEIKNPVEKLIATVGAFARHRNRGGIEGSPSLYEINASYTDGDAINQVLPGAYDRDSLIHFIRIGCEYADIGKWFASMALKQGIPTTELRNLRQIHRKKGLLRRPPTEDSRPTSGWKLDMPVYVDGSYVRRTYQDQFGRYLDHSDDRLTAATIIQMAHLLHYPESPK